PDRTVENVIEGVVITFVDIHDLQQHVLAVEGSHKAGAVAEALYQFSAGVAQTAREPLLVLHAELRVVAASRSIYDKFQTDPPGTERKHIYQLNGEAWNIPRLRQL